MLNKVSTILVQNPRLKQKIKATFVPTAMALFLSACTGGGFFQNEVTQSLQQEAYSSSEFYVRKAAQSQDQETQQSYRLLAIRKLLDENKLVEAKNMFATLSREFNEIQKIEYQLVSARFYVMQHNTDKANSLLRSIPLAELSNTEMKRYYTILASIAESNQDLMGAIRTHILLEKYLTNSQTVQQNNNKIWELLRKSNPQMLAQSNVKAGERSLAGWLSLIKLYNDNLSQPAMLPQAISQWKSYYPSHSASLLLPTELKSLTSFQTTQFSNISLLLPLSGNLKFLGEIIQQGFNDARSNSGDNFTTVHILDSNSAPLDQLVQQAKSLGSQAIIGPLLKSKVDEMLSYSDLNGLSVLTLNATNSSRSRAKVCYYGLAPEAEAHSAANKIYHDNISQVVVVVPNDDFGRRSANAFSTRWRKLTNSDASVQYYNQAIDIVNKLQGMQGRAVYFLGTAEQLLEAKEALEGSELAGKFAIYSSSRSNSPNNNTDFKATMEGIKFSEIPLLAKQQNLAEQFKKARRIANNDYSMMRLYAMGADAWLLINNFNELSQIPDFSVEGLTGELKSSVGCHIEREMQWLQYQGGNIVLENTEQSITETDTPDFNTPDFNN
ncbi:Penicillin-binding protein activator LpoA precursor [Phocoenobacter uteri]|uniref:Penicillin-binding protein activator LpoA n=1 Tax=Phocoenobacter uteri TaxID=146806 RepID=A0A379CBN6_9PAST|nr:penicillin-binding protein activator [Phocoenobacter uteri]SUB59703.1 Penicillin-binding protein activator LpoA precursor [Phocoenobacter uteri]